MRFVIAVIIFSVVILIHELGFIPARSIGIYDEVGSLMPGKRADIVIADRELNIVRVI